MASMPLRRTDPISARFLSLLTPRPSACTLLISLLVLSAVAGARASEPPDNVAAAVADAERQCKDLDGTPNSNAVLSMRDVNADGGEDWIADYAKLNCEGGLNPMCNADGCLLQIYL